MKNNNFKILIILLTFLVTVISLYNINIVTREMSDENLYTNRLDKVVFTYIQPGGVSDLAGLRADDILLAIDGEEVTSSMNAQQHLNMAKPGQSLIYTIERDGQLMDIKLDLALAGLRIWHLGSILAGILFVIYSLFLVFSKPDNKNARLMALAALMMAIIFINMNVSSYKVTSVASYKAVVMLITTNLFFAIAVIAHASLNFPERKYERVKPFLMIYNHYILAGILSCVSSYLLVVYNYFTPFQSIISIIYLITIELFHLRYRRKEYKARQKPFFITIAMMILALLMAFVISPQSVNAAYFSFVIILLPLSYFYTTVRFRVYDIQLRWRLSLVYNFLQIALIMTLLTLSFYGIRAITMMELNLPVIIFSGSFIELYDLQSVSPEAQEQVRTGYQILIGILLAFSAYGLMKIGKSLLDRIFFQQKYDYRIALKNFSDLLSSSYTREDISSQSVTHILKVMKLKGIMLAVPDNGFYSITNSAGTLSNMNSETFRLIPDIQARLRDRGQELLPEEISQIQGIDRKKNEIMRGIPITSGRDRLEAILFTGEKSSESPYNNEDMELLSYFIEHLGLAYERVHLYEEMSDKVRIKRELEIAREIQLKSLPGCEPDYPGLQICASLSAANEVAGDYYDYLEIDKNRLDIIVGDVTGKGASAAFHMSKIQGFVQTLSTDKTPAKLLLEKLNTLIHKSFEPEFFFTALYGMFDTEKKRLELYRLGHNGLIYYNSAQKRSQVLEPGGMGLGLSDQEKFKESLSSAIVDYQQDDIFAFLTDGFMEAMDADLKPFSEENICQLIAAHADKTASEIMNRLIIEVGEHCNNIRFDDSTGIIIKITT